MARIVKLKQDPEHPNIFWVRSRRAPKKVYRVEFHTERWTTCTCTHGMNNQGRAHCYHVEAAQALRARLARESGEE